MGASGRASLIDYGTTRSGVGQLRRQWVPEGRPRAIVLISHGISEHSGRYEAVGSQMADAGLGVVAIDQRGHGQTGGHPFHVESFTEFLDDIEDQIVEIAKLGAPVVLVGHSMGGLISTTYAISGRPSPDLVVLSGPALGVAVPDWQQTVVHKLAQAIPKLHPAVPFDPSVLSRDPAVADAYVADPLIKVGATVTLLSELMRTSKDTASRVSQLSVPTLCLHGSDDELVPADASQVLEGLTGVERRVLDGLRHEIFNEPEGSALVADVIAWIDSQLSAL